MGGCGDQGMGPELDSLDVLPVKCLEGCSEPVRAPAHLVECDKTVVNIKGRILDPLCPDRSCNLLEPHHKVEPFSPVILCKVRRIVEQEDRLEKVKDRFTDGRVLSFCPRYGA